MKVAALAYRELPETTRQEMTNLLTNHPAFPDWKEKYAAEGQNLEFGAYLFMQASLWPDEIRSLDHGHNKYSHKEWHYINYPLVGPAFRVTEPYVDGPDILKGIHQAEEELSGSEETPKERAIALSWLIHLLGDVHQPLHTVALIGGEFKKPHGDKGGNGVWVLVKEGHSAMKLHQVWDDLLGSRSKKARTCYNESLELRSRYPNEKLGELGLKAGAKEWSLQSRAVAVGKAYLFGKLAVTKERDQAALLPPDYLKNAKEAAERQAMLAALRLAYDIRAFAPPPESEEVAKF